MLTLYLLDDDAADPVGHILEAVHHLFQMVVDFVALLRGKSPNPFLSNPSSVIWPIVSGFGAG